MSNTEKKINYEMVIIARESRGFTQKELSKQLRITQGALSRVESGLLNLDESTLKRLSDILGYPVNFFTQKRKIYGVGLVEIFHRKRQTISIKTMDKIYSLIDVRTAEISKLLKGVELPNVDFPTFNIDDYDGSAKEVARLVRAKWLIPHGPIQNLTNYFEHAGGIILFFDFETNSIDAISHWLPGIPPIFFINKFMTADRMRFTIAHELGHMVMHQHEPNLEIERQANEFASELLMPEREIRPYLTNLSVEKLASLKPYWKVSMAALLKRAVDLKIVTPRHGRTIWMQLSKSGYKIREPMELDLQFEQPTLLKEIIDVYTHKMNYSILELAKMLNLFESEFQDIYIDKNEQIKLALEEVEHILKQQ